MILNQFHQVSILQANDRLAAISPTLLHRCLSQFLSLLVKLMARNHQDSSLWVLSLFLLTISPTLLHRCLSQFLSLLVKLMARNHRDSSLWTISPTRLHRYLSQFLSLLVKLMA